MPSSGHRATAGWQRHMKSHSSQGAPITTHPSLGPVSSSLQKCPLKYRHTDLHCQSPSACISCEDTGSLHSMRLCGLVSRGAEVGGSGTTVLKEAGEHWLEDRAKHDLGAAIGT